MKTWVAWDVFQRSLYLRSQAVEAISHIVIPATSQILVQEGNGIIASVLYQQSLALFADIAIEAERPVRNVTSQLILRGAGDSAGDSAVRLLHRESQEVAEGSLEKV